MTTLARLHNAYYDPDRHGLFDEPPPPPRCTGCGAFLKLTPDRTEPWEDGFDCDGTVTYHDEPYSPGLVAILGDEYEGKTYQVAVSACGVDTATHKPHREIIWAGVDEHRTCRRCDQDNVRREG